MVLEHPCYYYALICFNWMHVIMIEILILIINIIGSFITIFSFLFMNWEKTSELMRELFLVNFVIFIFMSISISLILLYRKKILIHNERGVLLSFFNLSLSIISLIYNIILVLLYINDVNGYKKNSKNKIKESWFILLKQYIFEIIFFILNVFLTSSDTVRIAFRINGSYNRYLKALKECKLTDSWNGEINMVTIKQSNISGQSFVNFNEENKNNK